MRDAEIKRSVYRFSGFELETAARELRKHGIRIRLQDQPLQILLLLLEHPGDVVTREEIQNRLWPPDTHVDYDNAINSAVRKLREALGDTSESPRFIETLSRRGYRFVGHIEAPRREKGPGQPVAAEQVAAIRARSKWKTTWVVLAGGASLVVAVAVGWWLRPGRITDSDPSPPVPLTSAAGEEGSPSFSPDGNQVAYDWNAGADGQVWHIYVKSIGSGKPLQLTADAKSDFSPAWSPDGRTIAFVRIQDPDSKQHQDIYTIPVLGGAERKVAEGHFARASWSPDGRLLAMGEWNSPALSSESLYLVNVENGDKFRLTQAPDEKTRDWDPKFSPDGRTLLFTRCRGAYQCGLYLLNFGADYRPIGSPRLLLETGGETAGTAWTADGTAVVYSQFIPGSTFSLMEVRIGGTPRPRPLLFATDRAQNPAISRRGNRLAYIQPFLKVGIAQIQADKPPRSFASSTRWDFDPQYSPNGKRVAFSSDRSGVLQIWVCDKDEGNPAQLTHSDAGPSGTPRWSPDGHWIAFDRQLKQGWRIYRMAEDGGQVRRLTQDEGNMDENIPSWSRDGKWIYYASNRTGRYEIWKAPAEGGSGTQVTYNGGFVALESPDGQSLYYMKEDSDSGVWVRPLQSREERLLLKSTARRSFAVTEDGVYFLVPNKSGEGWSLQLHHVATGKNVEVLTIKQEPFNTMWVSPDGKTILLGVLNQTGSNVMVVDNFR